jgi:MFS family permease
VDLQGRKALEDSVTAKPAPPSARSHYTLLILTLAYSCNVFDRNILVILLEPIRKEYGLTDTELGLLSGLAFAIFYAIAGLPFGILADRANRRNLLAICLAVWSGMSAVCALTRTFAQLLLARIGVGVSEAGGGPAAMSMIADLYPPERRATAISIFYLASPVGAFLSFAGGGAIAARYGWRSAFLLGGVPGLVLAIILFFTVKEPFRGRRDPRPTGAAATVDPVAQPATAALLRFFWSQRSLAYIVIGLTIQVFVLSGVGSWTASFFIRDHGFQIGELGPLLGGIVGGCSLLGTLAGGLIVDRLARRDERWRCWTLAIAVGVTTPMLLATFALPGRYAALGAFACASVFNSVWYGPGFALCQSLVGARMRGTIAAVMYLCSNLIGYGLGVQVTGLLSDFFAHHSGNHALKNALLVVSTADALAAVCFLLAAPHLRRDLSTAAQA